MWIGKKGCTESTIDEIRTQLRQRRIVKVRWLRNTDVDPEAIAARSGGRLVVVRGRTLVLTDQREKA